MDLCIAGLLFHQECPFDYKCLDMDCMECLKKNMDSKESRNGQGEEKQEEPHHGAV